jgi:predicted secreted protein
MSTQAAIGYGSKFELENAPASGVFVRIAEIDDLTPPNEKADVLDATNFDSPNGYKEFIAGMVDPGDVKFSMNFLPGSASETLILAARASRVAYAAKITFPAGQVWQFSLLVLEYSPAAPADKKMTCQVSGKVSGSIARS